jgi:hypothetical protein
MKKIFCMCFLLVFGLIYSCKPVENPSPAQPTSKFTIHTQYWTFHTNHYELIPNTSCIKFNGVDANSQKERVTCGDFTAYQNK